MTSLLYFPIGNDTPIHCSLSVTFVSPVLFVLSFCISMQKTRVWALSKQKLDRKCVHDVQHITRGGYNGLSQNNIHLLLDVADCCWNLAVGLSFDVSRFTLFWVYRWSACRLIRPSHPLTLSPDRLLAVCSMNIWCMYVIWQHVLFFSFSLAVE